MIIIKWIILLSIFLISSILGIMFANKYKDRVKNLKDIKSALNMLKTKIEYTYEPLPVIFTEIGSEFKNEIGKIFKVAAIKMEEISAGKAWAYAIENSKTSMQKEDLKVLENLKKLLGKTNIERTT